jgi:catechol 2,3-dioxygenase-like lactoylglutathione lyase family enzyme
MRVEHIALNVKDPAAVAKWYCEHLGMHVALKMDAGYFLADETGHGVIEIYNNPPDEVPDYANMNPQVLHLAFCSENLLQDYQRLLSAGAKAQGKAPSENDTYGVFMLRDPWGLTIQLVKRESSLLP